MNNTIIKLGSVTNSIKVKRMLMREGIKAETVKVGVGKGDNGCSYGVLFSSDKLLDVDRLQKTTDIEYSLV